MLPPLVPELLTHSLAEQELVHVAGGVVLALLHDLGAGVDDLLDDEGRRPRPRLH